MDYTDACTDVGDRRQRHDSCLRRKNLVDGLPFDPADKEKQVVYISTLGELLSYTFDFFDGNGTMYLQYKLYNEYTLVLTKDMDLETDTSWHEYAPDWETYGWPSRAICANIEGRSATNQAVSCCTSRWTEWTFSGKLHCNPFPSSQIRRM